MYIFVCNMLFPVSDLYFLMSLNLHFNTQSIIKFSQLTPNFNTPGMSTPVSTQDYIIHLMFMSIKIHFILEESLYLWQLLKSLIQLSCRIAIDLFTGFFEFSFSLFLVLAWAAATKFYRLGGLNKISLLSQNSGGCKFKIRMPARSGSGEDSLLGL